VRFLTDFADQAVILPMVLATAVALTVQGWRRGAAAWLLVIGATFAALATLKLVFLACSASFGTDGIHTPSGHVAAATVVAGGLAALLLRRRSVALPLALAAAIVIGIGLAVLAVWLHSPSLALFIAGGALIGAGSGAIFKGAVGTVMSIAPPGRIAESLTGVFLCAYVGISLPVVGAGITLARHVTPKTTILAFD